MKREKYTNATIFFKNCGENRNVFCTNRNFTKTLNKLQRCSWITDIEVVKYDLTDMPRG